MLEKKILVAVTVLMVLAACVFQNNVATAAEEVSFKITEVQLNDGKCTIFGYFYNNLDTDVRLDAVKFLGTLKDERGRVMYNIDFEVDASSQNCVIPAKVQYPADFTLTSDEVVAYNGEFTADMTWKIEYR